MRPLCSILFVGLAVSFHSPARAMTDVLRTQTGRAVHWATSTITIGLDPNAPSRTVSLAGAQDALQAAVDGWNETQELPLHFLVVSDPNRAVQVRFCRGQWIGDLDDLGKAVFSADFQTGVVASAVIEINECDQSFLPPTEVQDGRFDLQAVLAHEIGHLLGLGHSNNPEALMFSRGGTAGVRTPKADDRAGIALIYGTADHTTTPLAPQPLPVQPVRILPEPIEQAVRTPVKMPPADVVIAMRVATGDDTAVIIYTCEPTLLPPVSPIKADRQPNSRHTKSRRGRIPPAHAASRIQ
jgi:predicted Zn-dependent protease